MEQILIPPGWVDTHAPVATLLKPLDPHWPWWAGGFLLLAVALLTRRRRVLSTILAATGALILATACDGLVDDAYIQFRYAAHLAAGHGPVFNPGERLEGASGGLWIAAVVAGSFVGLEAGVAARLLSLCLSPVAALLAAATTARLAPAAATPVAVAWGALATPALYAASGLETSCWAVALWLLSLGLAAGNPRWAAGGAALGATVRPEALVLAALALPLWRQLPRAGRVALAAAVATLAALAAARLLYYGSPIPHAALVKGVSAAAGVDLGLDYLARALLEWWPLALVIPTLLRRRRQLAPALLPVLGWTMLVTARGGDWMPGSRYLVPLLVLLAAMMAFTPQRRQVLVAVLLLAWGGWRLAPLETPNPWLPGDLWRAMATHRVQSRWWEALGAWLGERLPPGTRLAVGPAGAIPYASSLPTFDLYGLNTRVARQGGVVPGHTLWGLPEAVAARCAVIVPGRPVPQTEQLPELYAAAQAQASEYPELAARYRPVLLVHPSQRKVDIVRDLVWVAVWAPGVRPP